jgi:hypothetical protein
MPEREPTAAEKVDMHLRAFVKSLCAPIWWESARQFVVSSGTMCLVKTPDAVLGITNNHVLKIYERHKREKADTFCQVGSAPFDPTEHLIDRSECWDLATFRIPRQTLRNFGHKVFVPKVWPPAPINAEDDVVFGGYPEIRRRVPPGANPITMVTDFVSFRRLPNGTNDRRFTFHVDPAKVTWLPNVDDPLQPGDSLSGMSGGPCFRLIPKEDRIELGGFIYEGDYTLGMIFCVQAALVSSTGQIAPPDF